MLASRVFYAVAERFCRENADAYVRLFAFRGFVVGSGNGKKAESATLPDGLRRSLQRGAGSQRPRQAAGTLCTIQPLPPPIGRLEHVDLPMTIDCAARLCSNGLLECQGGDCDSVLKRSLRFEWVAGDQFALNPCRFERH